MTTQSLDGMDVAGCDAPRHNREGCMNDRAMSAAKRTLKPIPKFRTEAEERRFWQFHDTSEFVDWSKVRDASFPDLKPTTTTISLRLPSTLLSGQKNLANKQDVPYSRC
jgi:predicted DNA binding CopG/RHH family protein